MGLLWSATVPRICWKNSTPRQRFFSSPLTLLELHSWLCWLHNSTGRTFSSLDLQRPASVWELDLYLSAVISYALNNRSNLLQWKPGSNTWEEELLAPQAYKHLYIMSWILYEFVLKVPTRPGHGKIPARLSLKVLLKQHECDPCCLQVHAC